MPKFFQHRFFKQGTGGTHVPDHFIRETEKFGIDISILLFAFVVPEVYGVLRDLGIPAEVESNRPT